VPLAISPDELVTGIMVATRAVAAALTMEEMRFFDSLLYATTINISFQRVL
jgi:hypothetical protein